MSSKWTSRFASLLAAGALAFSCTGASDDPTGGETHFLTRCQPGANSCGERLTCVCGVCTVPCTERDACRALPAAQCVLSCTSQDPQAAPGVCDVACVADPDCAVVSPAHRCEQGVCRAGSRESSGAGGSAGSPSAGAGGAASSCSHGEVTANEVLIVGDSFFASNHQITAYLESLARDGGALPAGARYRDRSSLVGNALALSGTGIADQYASGVSEAQVKVAIMNGGGADALLGSCDSADASCPVLAAAAAAAQDLLARMAADHVQHVVYAFYPDPGDQAVRAKVDALRPLIQSACQNAPLPCHWLDLRDAFAGHYGQYILPDQLNPTDAGARTSAAAIWAVMQQYCIAQ